MIEALNNIEPIRPASAIPTSRRRHNLLLLGGTYDDVERPGLVDALPNWTA